MSRTLLICSGLGLALAISSVAHAQTSTPIFADWTGVDPAVANATSGKAYGTLNNVPYTVTFSANTINPGGPVFATTNNNPHIWTDTLNRFSQPWMQPAKNDVEAIQYSMNFNNTPGNFFQVDITFDRAVSDVRLMIDDLDYSRLVKGANAITVVDSTGNPTYGGDAVYANQADVGNFAFYDGDASDVAGGSTTNGIRESAAGTLLFNNGGSLTNIRFRFYDNPNFTTPSDGMQWTLATTVPEPSSVALAGLGLAGLLLRRRRA